MSVPAAKHKRKPDAEPVEPVKAAEKPEGASKGAAAEASPPASKTKDKSARAAKGDADMAFDLEEATEEGPKRKAGATTKPADTEKADDAEEEEKDAARRAAAKKKPAKLEDFLK